MVCAGTCTCLRKVLRKSHVLMASAASSGGCTAMQKQRVREEAMRGWADVRCGAYQGEGSDGRRQRELRPPVHVGRRHQLVLDGELRVHVHACVHGGVWG